MKPFLQPLNIPTAQYETLARMAAETLAGCRAVADDGTPIYRPDASGHYDALWTRDFCYMLEGAGNLIDPAEALTGIDFILSRQREDGTIPDRVTASGEPIYLAGPVDRPLGRSAPTDNGPFMVKLVAAYVKLTGDLDAFLARRSNLYSAVDRVPLSTDMLVFIDPNRPHPDYGFTDCVAKTGNVWFGTILYWEACQTLAKLCARCEYHDEAHSWYEQAEHTSRRMGDFWDERIGLYRAASEDCNQLDLWGSVYACVIRAASKSHTARIAEYLAAHWDRCVLHGQLRHLPGSEHWRRLIADVPRGTYQNGGFWATPTGWLAKTMRALDEAWGRRVIDEVTADFEANGVCEWIGPREHCLPGYGASIANVLGAVQPSKKLDLPAEGPEADTESSDVDEDGEDRA